MAKKKSTPPLDSNSVLKSLKLVRDTDERLEYFRQFKDIKLFPQSPVAPLAEIEEIEFNPNSLELLKEIDRFSTPSPNACYFWLLCEDMTERMLSIGAIGLLYVLIRSGAASKVASLFFLTPSVTAVMAFLLFDESLHSIAVAGLLVTAAGVALVMRTTTK